MDTVSAESERPVVLEACGLCVAGGRRTLLEGFDFVLRRGEVHALVGKNGTGKSTLLKILSSMRAPRSGTVKASSERIGALIEEPSFLPELTGLANAEYLACALGVADPAEEARRVLNLVGLIDEVGEEVAGDYSGGQKRRLGIALALIGDPAVVLLDEPFNFVDLSGVSSIKKTLKRLAQKRGTSILIASHVCDHVVGFVDRFSFIADGQLTFQATAQEIEEACDRYVLLETAEPERALAVIEQDAECSDAILDKSGNIRIRAKAVPAKLLQELETAGIAVREIRSCGETYEDLFCRLLESGR